MPAMRYACVMSERRPYCVGGNLRAPEWTTRLALVVVPALLVGACEPRAQSAQDWDRHDAYQFCNAAIADYPRAPAPPCEAMHMCANEGALSAEETKKLYEMIAQKPKCPAP